MTRRRALTVTALAVLGIAAASAVDWPLRLIWNATASAPIGFYTVEPADRIDVPDLVAIMPPEPLAAFMVERGYIALGVPLLKPTMNLSCIREAILDLGVKLRLPLASRSAAGWLAASPLLPVLRT